MTKISNLTAVTSLLTTDELVLARTGTSRKITALAAGLGTTVRKASDESVASSTTDQNDDELFFTATSGKAYEIEVVLIYGSPAGAGTPDIKVDLGEDATIRGSYAVALISAAEAAAVTAILSNQATFSAGTAAADRMLRAVGHHVGGGGTWRVRWAQNTSGVNATIVRAGSYISYRQLN